MTFCAAPALDIRIEGVVGGHRSAVGARLFRLDLQLDGWATRRK